MATKEIEATNGVRVGRYFHRHGWLLISVERLVAGEKDENAWVSKTRQMKFPNENEYTALV